MTEVAIGENVTEIDSWAFSGCTSLATLTIPNNVIEINFECFAYCSTLTEVTIGNNIDIIEEDAFMGCSELTTVNYNATNCTLLGNISQSAFSDCTNFTTLNIGHSVTGIPNGAFNQCNNLTHITCLAATPPTIESYTFSNYDATLFVPYESIDIYKSTSYWKKFTIKSLNDINGLNNNGISTFDITIANGKLIINGTTDDKTVNIYRLNGTLLYSTTIAKASQITLCRGSYLVQAGGIVKKIIL